MKLYDKKTAFQLRNTHTLVSLFLVIITTAVYWPVGRYGFFKYDDAAYVSKNSNVETGLTLKGAAWAFSSFHAANWHPLTWLSHMMDVELYGLNPGAHHLTNLILHILNTLLLFHLFRRMTETLWQSAFVAVVFALHPLHVESVAWIAERKDVLSTFFGFLTVMSYIRYLKRRGAMQYLMVVLFFALGLMAKPMLMTLPIILLLLDYWPLGRFEFDGSPSIRNAMCRHANSRLVFEKIPLLILSAASSIVTIFAQKQADAIKSLYSFSIHERIANCLLSYIRYIAKTLWPSNLAFQYPYSHDIPMWQALGALLLLGSISMWVVKYSGKYPYLFSGWAWYLVTLIPVIGLVQVGVQAMADRYTYIPMIGLSVVIAWGVPELLRRRHQRILLTTGIVLVTIFLSAMAIKQVRYWENSITLFNHSLRVTQNNYQAHLDVADAFAEENRIENAIDHYKIALQIMPDFAEAHNKLGVALARKGEIDQAISHYREAIRLSTNYPKAQNNLGTALIYKGRLDEAIAHYTQSVLMDPACAATHNNLGLALLRQGRIDRAVRHFQQAVQNEPGNRSAKENLRRAQSLLRAIDEALNNLEEALIADPETVDITCYSRLLANRKQQLNSVIDRYRKALTSQPNFSSTELNLGNYSKAKKVFQEYDALFPLYRKTSEQKPGSLEASYYIRRIDSIRRR